MSSIIRRATDSDIGILAQMNDELIVDEQHRNLMSLEQLHERMQRFLSGGYTAIVAESESNVVGYLLFRRDREYTYIRQLYVDARSRRLGIGSALVNWVINNQEPGDTRLRIDVLVGNQRAIDFWRAFGFRDYMLTLELPLDGPSDS